MNRELTRIVESRLEQAGLSAEAGLMVLAALEGPQALAELLTGAEASGGEGAPKPAPETPGEPSKPSATYLSAIAIEGFRGIGPRAELEVRAGPGLTLVVGRNGSGKSSFSEGLELLLTGENRRWSERSRIWKEGWRNLHHGGGVSIEATFHVERHPGPTVVSRAWPAGADLEDGGALAQHHGEPRGDYEALGWAEPLAAYRPFLSYNELGSMLNEGPTKLYDALSAILGLEDLVAAQEALRQARLTRARAMKELLKRRDQALLPALQAVEDPRVEAVTQALLASPIGLQALEKAVLSSEGEGAAPREIELLNRLKAIAAPDLEEIGQIAGDLRAAADAIERVAGTDSALARDTLELLESALEFRHQHDAASCPVCEAGALDEDWAARAEARKESLEQAAAQAEEAHASAEAAIERVRRILTEPPAVLAEAGEVGLEAGELRACWERLIAGAPTADLRRLADHVESQCLELEGHARQLVESARELHARLEDKWRPVAAQIAAFAADARAALAGEARAGDLKRAEDWLKAALADIRNERFAPISEQCTAIWETFGSPTNVELASVALTGSHGHRRVELDVRVDGADGAALGVMSQGELHALALSLFLPRATLPESPFGMVVIDDPVQAMDPARVDGLARVLNDVAVVKQVIVFTHDDRLPESVRRLGFDAHIVEVVRRESSVVELRDALDPVSRYLDDARALARTDKIPDEVAHRVIPGFCRLALEAACAEVTRRRRIGRGERHGRVERALLDAQRLSQRMALALFDDPARSGDVLARLDRLRTDAGDTYQDCNRGAHEPQARLDPDDLIRRVGALIRDVRALR